MKTSIVTIKCQCIVRHEYNQDPDDANYNVVIEPDADADADADAGKRTPMIVETEIVSTENHGECPPTTYYFSEPSGQATLHPTVRHILKYFHYRNEPEFLQKVNKPFCILANQVAYRSPKNPETAVVLRKLLEANDAAFRACLSK